MKKARLFAGLAACLFAFGGCGPNAAPQGSLPAPETLVVYTPHREEIYQPIIKEFEERTGIWVTVVTGGSNELFGRIADEAASPECDVIFGGSAESHDAYAQWLEPYEAEGLTAVEPGFRSPSGLWTPFSVLPIVLIYNTKLVPASGVPTTWAQLLQPEWRGRIAFANPNLSASCCTGLVTIAQALPGPEWEIIAAFAENLGGEVLEGSGQIITAVVDGKYAVGVALEEAAFRARAAGQEVGFVYPTEGTSALPDASSLIKNAPHADNARRFIDFTITRDIQHMVTSQFARRSVFIDADPPSGLLPLADIPLLKYDYEWSVANHKEILARWQREF